ncbi:MAG: penicillin-binding protein 2, partial [Verrucomicrobiales bacterium]|nr:penicillin-binding protein 2 [Verrucomicrobiales bacterium]
MELTRQRARFFWMGILLVLAFCCLGYRLVQLQVVRHGEFRALANRSHALMIPLKGHRGDIRDLRGEVLARSLPAKMICADPSLVGDRVGVLARVLAPLLRTNEAFLVEALQPRLRTNELGEVLKDRFGRPQTNQFVGLKRRVPDEEWKAIQAVLARETFGLPETSTRSIRLLRQAVYPSAEEDEIRIYPNRTLAAAVLGFTDTDGRGLEGLEAFLNDSLKGVNGYIETERSRRGGELRQFREVVIPPQHGRDVFLTLDARLQLIVEEELAATVKEFHARGACGVAIQPRTGRILAMASLPTYDPNVPPLATQDGPRRRNRAIAHTFEPGSTFKIVAATAALNEGLLDLADTVDCGEKGVWRQTFGREKILLRDSHAMKERYAPVERVIAESSNIGTFQMALRLGRERYADYLFRFGFDQKTGVRLPVEEHGQLRP